ncbi:hypothetical protein ALO91_103489 [Pseudomonas syringae pv. aceris]|uniref:Uncharacterized protein n=1 Tax=Pseudomonas syringae pv. aceris TaxID=199198 RepID=A0A0L8IR32_PSESX|nr:hypothetical protein PSYAR_12814 [Pseudomonas syringae pv. aceris str. M302273]KOG03589.1 Uncharacterized protein ABJ98_2427 [Pseudomonas syringae pv. aceris]KPW15870.1 hypothetical protein ALO91_103489 [Pseudomonas syringae pv. aceris]
MPSIHLTNVRHDLETTAAHLEVLHRMLEGHAIFLKHKPHGDQSEELC